MRRREIHFLLREPAIEHRDSLAATCQRLDDDLHVVGHVGDHALIAEWILVDAHHVRVAPDVEQALGCVTKVVANQQRRIDDGP